MTIGELRARIANFVSDAGVVLREFYLVPWRGSLARAKRQEEDLFMLLVYSEMLGIPNPAGFHTLELQPLLYEDFHDWHRRMGMEHSPLDWFRCC